MNEGQQPGPAAHAVSRRTGKRSSSEPTAAPHQHTRVGVPPPCRSVTQQGGGVGRGPAWAPHGSDVESGWQSNSHAGERVWEQRGSPQGLGPRTLTTWSSKGKKRGPGRGGKAKKGTICCKIQPVDPGPGGQGAGSPNTQCKHFSSLPPPLEQGGSGHQPFLCLCLLSTTLHNNEEPQNILWPSTQNRGPGSKSDMSLKPACESQTTTHDVGHFGVYYTTQSYPSTRRGEILTNRPHPILLPCYPGLKSVCGQPLDTC